MRRSREGGYPFGRRAWAGFGSSASTWLCLSGRAVVGRPMLAAACVRRGGACRRRRRTTRLRVRRSRPTRAAKDATFARERRSPVPQAKRAEFLPLAYFPIDPSYNVPAALSRSTTRPVFEMPTSTGTQPQDAARRHAGVHAQGAAADADGVRRGRHAIPDHAVRAVQRSDERHRDLPGGPLSRSRSERRPASTTSTSTAPTTRTATTTPTYECPYPAAGEPAEGADPRRRADEEVSQVADETSVLQRDRLRLRRRDRQQRAAALPRLPATCSPTTASTLTESGLLRALSRLRRRRRVPGAGARIAGCRWTRRSRRRAGRAQGGRARGARARRLGALSRRGRRHPRARPPRCRSRSPRARCAPRSTRPRRERLTHCFTRDRRRRRHAREQAGARAVSARVRAAARHAGRPPRPVGVRRHRGFALGLAVGARRAGLRSVGVTTAIAARRSSRGAELVIVDARTR